MGHRYNIAAFEAVRAEGNPPLVRLYCGLVVIELALKDGRSPWQSGHDVASMLAEIGETSLSVQLRGRIGELKCTAKDGTEAPVGPSQYPNIRYIRHESDFPGTVMDIDLNTALAVVADIVVSLRQKGLL